MGWDWKWMMTRRPERVHLYECTDAKGINIFAYTPQTG